MPKRYELPDLRPRDLVRLRKCCQPADQSYEVAMYLDHHGRGHWVHLDFGRSEDMLRKEGWELWGCEDDFVELGRLRNVDEREISERWWSALEPRLRAAPPLQAKAKKGMQLVEIPNVQAGDLFILRAAVSPHEVVMYFPAPNRALYLGEVGEVGPTGLENARQHPGHPLGSTCEYTIVARLRGCTSDDFTVERWSETERRLRAATAPKVGDVLTREQVAALPAGAVTQDLDMAGMTFVEQWNGEGRGRVVGVTSRRLGEKLDDEWGERPRPARLVALGTPLDDRRAVYRALADQGFKPAIAALAGEPNEPKPSAPVTVSATGTMVQVGDMVETTQEALTALPAGAVVHFWDPDGWCNVAHRGPGGLRWIPSGNEARPWNINRRQAVVIALDCPDRDSAVKARDAFLARPYKGQEREAALATYLEGKISAEVKAALDKVADVGLNDQMISAVSGVVDRVLPVAVTFQGFAADDFASVETEEARHRREEWYAKMLAKPAAIEYREPMPEIKSAMKIDPRTQTLEVVIARLPGELDDHYTRRVAEHGKNLMHSLQAHAAPAVASQAKVDTAGEIMLAAQPSWLERAAEVFKPVAAELAAEAKTQTRQAIALGGVEVARAAMHKGIAAAAQAVAPQHADKVVQVVDHPITHWLENAGLFLGARAAGRPALAQVGLREVVRSPLEGAAGVLVQAASQVVDAVKGALVAADEAARVEQVTGQPEAARVSAGE